ncbi:amidohydrolase family protein [Ihubacter sp. mB4P-1]|uniref:amidohydrolase family protein n=1 Tax=Ihubacter sp. mB4P-1 TaxID=3242370 RepID=UPI00137B467D
MGEKYLLKSSRIYDSEKRALVPGVITVEDGKITDFAPNQTELPENSGEYRVIDAGSDVIAPGFIDIHSHEDEFDETDKCQVADDMIRMGVTTCIAGNCGGNYQPIPDFLEHIERYGISANYVMFSGYNYKRDEHGLGIDIYMPCGKDERRKAAEAVMKDLELGAVGMSLGLEYAPGVDVEEVVDVMNMIGRTDIPISIHIRDDKEASVKAVAEAIEISEKTHLPVIISHIGSLAAYGQMREVFRLIREAHARGTEIYVDCYPYNAFATNIGSAVFDEKSIAEGKFTFDQMMFCTGPFTGKFCTDELYKLGREKYPDDLVVGFGMHEEDICYAYSCPETMVSSDGWVTGEEGHPRTAGSFPRVLGKYVREEHVLTLEDALAKMTIMPAEVIGLSKKGRIAAGMDADLVIFDPDKIIDKADYTHVNEPPEGIKMVMLAGHCAVVDNEIKGRYGVFIPRKDF